MTKIAFLGLGVMGYPMAGHLAAAGHSITVYNRTKSKAEAWVKQHTGVFCTTPAKASSGAEIVMACVGNDLQYSGFAFGEKIVPRNGYIVTEMNVGHRQSSPFSSLFPMTLKSFPRE